MSRLTACLTLALAAIALRSSSPVRRPPIVAATTRGPDTLRILTTIGAAEAEGAALPRGEMPAHIASYFAGAWFGSPERRCQNVPAGEPFPPNSVRSGNFIIRLAPLPLRAARGAKILWLPLHNPYEYPSTLLLRAARLGSPGDSLRVAVPHWAWEAKRPKRESGFPSTIALPRPGQWLVVATASSDWGCFVLPVSE